MTNNERPSARITSEVGSWPGVEIDTGELGEVAFRVAGREIGHVHGDRAAHFSFPHALWDQLYDDGRIVHHPVFPGKRGPAARVITNDGDVRDVITLMRVNYERVVARRGLEGSSDSSSRPQPGHEPRSAA
jgi:hypothetical protein